MLLNILWFIVVTTILSKFGISVEGVIASAGVVGLAVGFGAQTIVKDVITGFFIIFENQFDVGDYVKINNGGTTVEREQLNQLDSVQHALIQYLGNLQS